MTPRLLLQDATGLRTPCTGAARPARRQAASAAGLRDGRRAAARRGVPAGRDRRGTSDRYADARGPSGDSRVAVTLTVPGSGPPTARPGPPPPRRRPPGSSPTRPSRCPARRGHRAADDRDRRRSTAPPDAARTLVATAFPDPGPVPVAVSARFAERGRRPTRGAQLSVTVGTTPVPIVVAEVLPTVPSAPGAAAVLADLDALSRALAVTGDLTFPVDAWWVGHPTGRRRRAGRPPCTSAPSPPAPPRPPASPAARCAPGCRPRSGCSSRPRRCCCSPASSCTSPATCRSAPLEVARLRGLGMSRRDIRAVLLGQHAGVLLPLLAAGAAVGALATRLVAPLLVRSDTGAAPVPAAAAALAVGRRGRPARRAAGRVRARGRRRGHRPGPPGRRRAPAGGVVNRPRLPLAGPALAQHPRPRPRRRRAAAARRRRRRGRRPARRRGAAAAARHRRRRRPGRGPPRRRRRRRPGRTPLGTRRRAERRPGPARRASPRTSTTSATGRPYALGPGLRRRAAPAGRRRHQPDPQRHRRQRAAHLPAHLPGRATAAARTSPGSPAARPGPPSAGRPVRRGPVRRHRPGRCRSACPKRTPPRSASRPGDRIPLKDDQETRQERPGQRHLPARRQRRPRLAARPVAAAAPCAGADGVGTTRFGGLLSRDSLPDARLAFDTGPAAAHRPVRARPGRAHLGRRVRRSPRRWSQLKATSGSSGARRRLAEVGDRSSTPCCGT